ncbi:hypothetical protein [Actinomadura monticuli]|uniref:Uncharacterized protein n=1 Tax=Actinomadura monticuli TaxID=3097367 RepID=A0ABV4Q6A7_9ACTN
MGAISGELIGGSATCGPWITGAGAAPAGGGRPGGPPAAGGRAAGPVEAGAGVLEASGVPLGCGVGVPGRVGAGVDG